MIQVAAPLSPAVALLAAPLTTKIEVQRREKKCRKNFETSDPVGVGAKEIENSQNRRSGVDLRK